MQHPRYPKTSAEKRKHKLQETSDKPHERKRRTPALHLRLGVRGHCLGHRRRLGVRWTRHSAYLLTFSKTPYGIQDNRKQVCQKSLTGPRNENTSCRKRASNYTISDKSTYFRSASAIGGSRQLYCLYHRRLGVLSDSSQYILTHFLENTCVKSPLPSRETKTQAAKTERQATQ